MIAHGILRQQIIQVLSAVLLTVVVFISIKWFEMGEYYSGWFGLCAVGLNAHTFLESAERIRLMKNNL